MKMAKALVILAAILAMCMGLGMAANYTVGGNGGWGEGIDYQTWASSITFVVGDNLIFRYMPNHNVNEVSKTDFDSCSPDNPIQPPFNGGSAVIPLTAPGTRYFICGTSGHCVNGMNVAINIVAASAPPPSIPPPPPASPPSVPPPPPVSTPPPTTTPSVPPTSSPSVPSLPPTPSAHRPVSSPPPLKSAAPSTPPTHSPKPAAPKVSPSTPPSKGSPAQSPATAPTPASSLPATPPTSSAAKVNLLAGLIAGIGSALLMFLNF